MQLFFLHENLLNTTILTETGRTLYEVETPNSYNQITTIRRVVESARLGHGPIVAQVEWRSAIGTSRVKYLGVDMWMDDLLRKASLWGSSRIFTGSDKVEYEWKIHPHSGRPHLFIANTGNLVAQFHRAQNVTGTFQPPCNNYIELSTQAIGTLELVVITGLIIEIQKRKDEAQEAMAAQSSA